MTTEIVEYSETAAGLAELKSRVQHVIYDVTTTIGMESARKDRRECVTLRTSLDKLRLSLNADDQERIRARNGRAKELEAEILALEKPIDEQIKTEEQRKEAEKQARLDAERARVDAIRAKISAIGRAPVDAIGAPLDEIRSIRKTVLSAKPAAAEFEELTDEAINVWTRAAEQLENLIGAAERNTAEQARLAAEREAFEEQRREQARIDAEAKALRDAADKAAREQQQREEGAAKAERDRQDREAKERRDAEDLAAAEERARIDAEAKVQRDAEEKRLADERAEVERVAAANRKAAEDKARKAEQAAQAKRAKHEEAIASRLAKFRSQAGGAEFVDAAIDYRNAEIDVATEKLVALCDLYAKRPARAGTPLVIAGQAA